MNTPGQEKRYSERIFFPPDDSFSGNFLFTSDTSLPTEAYIMDLSLLGIGISMIKEKFPPVQQGDFVTLYSVSNADGLSFMRNIELEIRWILNHRSLEHVALGCAFTGLEPSVKQYIVQFIKNWKYRNQGE